MRGVEREMAGAHLNQRLQLLLEPPLQHRRVLVPTRSEARWPHTHTHNNTHTLTHTHTHTHTPSSRPHCAARRWCA
jgi:hypothetical protein